MIPTEDIRSMFSYDKVCGVLLWKGADALGRPRNATRPKIGIDGKRIFLGYYDTPHDAGAAYARASDKYHGDYGRAV